jgi:hypothetical protein
MPQDLFYFPSSVHYGERVRIAILPNQEFSCLRIEIDKELIAGVPAHLAPDGVADMI